MLGEREVASFCFLMHGLSEKTQFSEVYILPRATWYVYYAGGNPFRVRESRVLPLRVTTSVPLTCTRHLVSSGYKGVV